MVTVLSVCFFAWQRYVDDETNVYLSFVNSYAQIPEFERIVLVGVVDDCGFGTREITDKIIQNLVKANAADKAPSDLRAIAHVANVMMPADLKTIENSRGRLKIQSITGKDPVYLSRVAFDENHNVAIMCVGNGHTRRIVYFKKKNISEWVLAE